MTGICPGDHCLCFVLVCNRALLTIQVCRSIDREKRKKQVLRTDSPVMYH